MSELPTEKLRIAARITGREYGERRAHGTGESIEFHDFREYQPGDEPRAIDWRTYARTRRLYTRLYRSERTVHAHFVIDTSASMDLHGKADRARDIAELLARVALAEMSVQFHTFSGTHSPVATRLAEFPALATALAAEVERPPEPTLAPSVALLAFARKLAARRGRALVVIISDFFDHEALKPAFMEMRLAGAEIIALQLLSEAEWTPALSHAELVDVETHDRLRVTDAEARQYEAEVRRFVERRRREVQAAGGRHVLLPIGSPQPRALLLALLRAGIVTLQ